MRTLIVVATAAAMLFEQQATAAGQVDDLGAARAANAFAHGQVTTERAQAVVPGYTANPPEAAFSGDPDLRAAARSRLAHCAVSVEDPVCQAQVAASALANAPRETIAPTDPAVEQATAIRRNPFGVASSLQDLYSGCASTGICTPGLFCVGERCFDITNKNDPDFAQAMTYMEAAREAAVYIDPATVRVFTGEDNRCRERLLKNCCHADSAGAGFTNQSLFGIGSRLVFDILMNSNNRRFLTQGLNALFTGAGFSGTFKSYGVSIAVSGTPLPAGTVPLYSGPGISIAVDPYSLAIAIVMYVALSMMSCNEEEGKLAMKEGAKLCHRIGSFCSRCIRVLGKCVACIERTTSKCCFNSTLARLINEQGREQLGIGWGKPKRPACEGFTVAQLQALDFSRMDLTEFYASIVPTLPDIAALRATNKGRAANCIRGGGKC
ncbi:conjugal transfer protein TraN [Massilia sp. YMA4]|uniref:Conjugal transfer protein TraN n=1 Tax=[Empedobacter] haloabium TaxID=592317 RepID=A0ABZ1URM9_9BURK|nr:conjugal transfer protein TraN [Massilia sp. YMA4]